MSWQSNKNQSGIVSILIVIIIMSLLSLVSLGFSKLMNREVRQSLDTELNAQAFYSAESGVNDARIFLDLKNGNSSFNKCHQNDTVDVVTAHGHHHYDGFVDNGDISGDGVSRYSCVLMQSEPKDIQLHVKAGQTEVFSVKHDDIDKMIFSWQNDYSDTGMQNSQPLGNYHSTAGDPGPPELPVASTLDNYKTGLLRISIYPAADGCPGSCSAVAGGSLPNTDLADRRLIALSRSYLMYPNKLSDAELSGGPATNKAGRIDYQTAPNGGFVKGNCGDRTAAARKLTLTNYSAGDYYCNSIVTGLQNIPGNHNFYVSVTPEYQPLHISIQATHGAGNDAKRLKGIQGIIDVTGNGNDVIRRVQARVSLDTSRFNPGYALQSMEAVCKIFRVSVDGPTTYGTAQNDDPGNIAATNDNVCIAPNGTGTIVSGGTPPTSIAPAPTVHVTADSTSLYTGQSTNVAWTSTGATGQCYAEGAWGTGNVGQSGGPMSTGPLAAGDYTYKMTCYNDNGDPGYGAVTISVTNAPTPTLAFYADSNSVAYGTGTTLHWSSTDANSCTASGSWDGAVPTSGVTGTGALTSSPTYYLDCSGPGGSVHGQVTINVGPPPPPDVAISATFTRKKTSADNNGCIDNSHAYAICMTWTATQNGSTSTIQYCQAWYSTDNANWVQVGANKAAIDSAIIGWPSGSQPANVWARVTCHSTYGNDGQALSGQLW
jgi:hypothetical protein